MGRKLGRAISGLAAFLLFSAVAAGASAGDPAQVATRLLDYDPGLDGARKTQVLHGTTAVLASLGIHVRHDRETLAEVLAAGDGSLSAAVLDDRDALYDAVHYLTDLTRLPAGLHPLFDNILIVRSLKVRDALAGGRMRSLPIAYEPVTGTILIDHQNLNQLALYGNFVHPKVNFAMVLEVALEARLRRMSPAARRDLGLEVVVDDAEWLRLNGGRSDGRSAYNGEDVSFVGLKTAARVTPPGIFYDAVREGKSGVPDASYAGLPDPSQFWWSPRHGPAADRQNLLRCLFTRSPGLFDRIGGLNGVRQDRVLQEKTRLILYAAFVASGGVLDAAYWQKRHPGNLVLAELSRDFDAGFLARLNQRLQRNPETRGLRLEPARR
jgi:chloramphenicol 3-O-phosphotransferase